MTVHTAASPTFSGSHTESAQWYQEGLVAGGLGAAAIALWFLILDSIEGRPFYTPSVLGTALFHGAEAVASPADVPVSLEMVLVFTWVHLLVFGIIGAIAARLVVLAEHNPNLGFGLFLFFVFFEFGFVVVSMAMAQAVLQTLTMPAILIGNLLAAGTMAAYFWRRHPHLAIRP